MTIKVLGVRQTTEALREMADAIQIRVTRKAMRAAGKVILQAVRATTYQGDRDRQTGLLKRGLALATSSKRGVVTTKIVQRSVNITGKSKVAQRVRAKNATRAPTSKTASAYYWRFLEKGTKNRQSSGGASRGHIAPSPWIVPAFDAKSMPALEKFKAVFAAETDAEARRIYQQQGRPP